MFFDSIYSWRKKIKDLSSTHLFLSPESMSYQSWKRGFGEHRWAFVFNQLYLGKDLGPRTHGNVFLRFLYCLLFSRESRTTSSLLETIQNLRKTFPCVRGPYSIIITVLTLWSPGFSLCWINSSDLLNKFVSQNETILKTQKSRWLSYVYTLRIIGTISCPGKCDLMVLPRKHSVIFWRMHFVTFVRI